MFKSLEFTKNSACAQDQYLFKIIDDDFEEEIIGETYAGVIIKCYSQKSLPITPNLVRLIQYLHQKYEFKISFILSTWLERVLEYKPYHESVQKQMLKYLTLI